MSTRQVPTDTPDAGVPSEAIGSGRDSLIPWDAIQAEWRERSFSLLGREVGRRGGDAVKRHLERLFKPDSPKGDRPGQRGENGHAPDEPPIAEILGEGFAAVAGDPDGPILLALYVYGRCLLACELSADYTTIAGVVEALREAAGPLLESERLTEADAKLLRTAVEHAQSIKPAMDVEDAVQCSCPVAMAERAALVVDGIERLRPNVSGTDGPSELLRARMEAAAVYFGELGGVGEDVATMIDRLEKGEPIDGHLAERAESLIKSLGCAALKGDVYHPSSAVCAQEVGRHDDEEVVMT